MNKLYTMTSGLYFNYISNLTQRRPNKNKMAKERDIVLIYIKNKPITFARIERIIPDCKLNWFKVKLMLLQVPVSIVTWILKIDYINGVEFKMGGQNIRLEKIVCPNEKTTTKDMKSKNHDNVIPLFKHSKK